MYVILRTQKALDEDERQVSSVVGVEIEVVDHSEGRETHTTNDASHDFGHEEENVSSFFLLLL